MQLDVDLISQFVKTTKDTVKTKKESIVYGVVVESDGTKYVKIDGSSILTPVVTTADINAGERVTVMIKNHTAVVTGNITSPSVGTEAVKEVEDLVVDKVSTADLAVEQERITKLESYAIKTTVLYSSETTGSGDVITLAASAADFEYLEVYFNDSNGNIGGSVKLYNPNTKNVCLHVQSTDANGSYLKQTTYEILGTSMTPNVETASYIEFSGDPLATTRTIGTNYIRITRVIGIAKTSVE